MKFDLPEQVESVCFQMRQGDWPRGQNRALINDLFNGLPPYSLEEAEADGRNVNVNFLESTRLGHEGRTQFYQAFQKPGNYFTCSTDTGAPHKRSEYGNIVTRQINRIMKRSIPYMECLRSKFAMDVLHGIAPAGFRDSQRWRPDAIGIEDVLVPSNTLLTMCNLPFFAIRKSFTAPELIKLTGPAVADPGWNKKMVKSCIKWVDTQSMALLGTNFPDVWSPEKMAERVKSDGGFYVGDSVPTIDVFDFYFWSDEGKKSGWRRRIVLDAWGTPDGAAGVPPNWQRKTDKDLDGFSNQFLYNPGNRVFATEREQIINWQFADLSAVAPFRYHSVRSLGFLLYSVCHLQNRMRCKFNEAVFEQMMIYFRVKSMEDAQRSLKVDLFDRAFIDDTIDFIKPQDRYQVNAQLVELGLGENRNIIGQNSASYTAQPQNGQRNNVEKTKFEVMAEVQSMTSLVSSGLQQAYFYQQPEYRETFRRFTIKDSRDPEVRTFQANCLKAGVPGRILYNPECWELEPDRVMGAGNKTLEMAIAQQLMQFRTLYDPEAQRQILHDVTLAITDDPARADDLVPDSVAKVTDSVHDAQLAAGTLMQGLPVAVKSGMNHVEYVETLIGTLMQIIQQGATSMERVMGMQNIAQNIAQHIAVIAQNPEEKQRVARYNQQMAKLMNLVKAMAQKLEEQQKAQGGQENGESQAKIQTMMMEAKVKADNTSQAHAQRTAQRQVQFEMEQQQKQKQFEMDMRHQQIETGSDLQLGAAETAHAMRLASLEAANDAKIEREKPKPKAEK